MELYIPKDTFDNPVPPRIFLCNTGKKKLGQLQAYDTSLNAKWNSWSELDFTIDRKYTDIITGETKLHPLFDKAEGLRRVYAEGIGYFIIQDPDTNYSDSESKTLSCFSIEYETSTKYLENFYVNNGEVDSIEVTYEASKYPNGMTKDDMYKLASSDKYNSNEKYFHRKYSSDASYEYEQIQITDEEAYLEHFKSDTSTENVLYVYNHTNVQFYDPYTPELSLLHNVFKKIPEWTIGHVDHKLWNKVRKFEEDRISVYDFLTNKITDTFKCVVSWDTINSRVNFYEEAEDGINEDNTIQTRYNTDVYVSRANLANEISLSYSTDDIKTKLKVTGSDDLNIRDINLGKNYIMNLSYYHTREWMEDDLYEAYQGYLDAVEDNRKPYKTAQQGWVSANKKYNELMNAIPAEGGVLLKGDEFTKLYCIYSPTPTAYVKDKIVVDTDINTTVSDLYSDEEYTKLIDKKNLQDEDEFVVQGYAFKYQKNSNNFKCVRNIMTTSALTALIKKLNLYHVDDDVYGTDKDNVLLMLKNNDGDSATIRIYDPHQTIDMYSTSTQYYTCRETFSNSGKFEYIKIYFSKNNGQEEFNAKIEALKATLTEAKKSYNEGKITAEQFEVKQKECKLYTNNYQVRVTIVKADTGAELKSKEFTIDKWVKGELTVDNTVDGLCNLKGYKVSYIGTMGAYFVTAKDETRKENLQDYGIKMLQEKQEVYTSIFQLQTEAMFSQEKYQCIVSDEDPGSGYAEGTRWLDSDSSPLKLYKYSNKSGWVETDGQLSVDDQKNYENYQRYIDNLNKLKAVQAVLIEKEKEATYRLNGYAVSDRKIVLSKYETDTSSLWYSDCQRAAAKHFDCSTTDISEDSTLRKEFKDKDGHIINVLYVFTTDKYKSGSVQFAVYLNGTTPYVAFLESQGVYQMQMNYYSKITELENFFDEDQWIRLSPFIREDEFNDTNYLLTGYESEEERTDICEELMDAATKELKSLSQPSIEFSMDMGNILAIPEFKSLTSQFQLGNFIRIELTPPEDGHKALVKRSRLLEVKLNFDDLSDFSCTFGNLVSAYDQVNLHAELLQQAVTAGKQVAASSGSWQKAVDKANKIDEDITNGLADATLEVGSANGQSIIWNQNGIWCRKLIDGTTDQYDDEQIRIINNKILYSSDGFKTSSSAFGSFIYNGEKYSGILARAVVGGFIQGSKIEGGELEIGGSEGKFVVHEDGSVEILGPDGSSAYASKSSADKLSASVKTLENARRYRVELSYNKSTVFSDPESECIITCNVYSWDEDITQELIKNRKSFVWNRISNAADDDTWKNEHTWNTTHDGLPPNQIKITNNDIPKNAQIECQIQIDD